MVVAMKKAETEPSIIMRATERDESRKPSQSEAA
jgi:hypothetical protein